MKNSKTPKFCGQTKLPLLSRVRIIKNSGEKDENTLIGLTGKATHPFAFGCTSKGWIGIWLDDETTEWGRNVNVHESEIEIIKD